MKFMTSILSEKGGRMNNEDACGFQNQADSIGVWVVCDGLGGQSAGEKASARALNTIIAGFIQDPDITKQNLDQIFLETNRLILLEQAANQDQANMGTTAVALFANRNQMAVSHVGDSRFYHFQDGHIKIQTEDHSVSELAVLTGEIRKDEIRFHADRNKLLRILGQSPPPKTGFSFVSLTPTAENRFLLCSDGFWEYITESEMEHTLRESSNPDEWMTKMVQIIRGHAPENQDNYSAIAIFALPD